MWEDAGKQDNLYLLPNDGGHLVLGKSRVWEIGEESFKKEKARWEKILEEKLVVGFFLKDLIKILKKYRIALPKTIFDCGVAMWTAASSIKTPELPQIGELPKIYLSLVKNIKEKQLEKILYEIEFPLIPILAEMESNGIGVDGKFLEKFKKEIFGKAAELENKIYKASGAPFNINSPAQVSEILFEKLKIGGGGRRTKTGRRSTRESELAKFKDKEPIVRNVLDYRELMKLLTTYIEPLLELSEKDGSPRSRFGGAGRVHTTFNQTGTVTGRLSSENPNLQNIPIRSEFGAKIRGAFAASTGFTFAAFDYSQIELKILAALSGDAKMIEAFKRGLDIHKFTASNINNVPMEKVTPEMRGRAKTINFGIVFGMGTRQLARSTGMTLEEAGKFYREYFSDFPQISAYINKAKEDVKKNGFTQTLFGRKRFFNLDTVLGDDFLESEMERMAVNAIIQGTDADIVKKAMIAVADTLDSKKIRPILQIHDELLYEIEDDTIREAIPRIRSLMEGACQFAVPLSVDIKIGKRWGSLKIYAE